MASIHLGRLRGPSGFVRTVAIKRLHPQYARDPLFVSMFMDEAHLVARVRHPNVVPIVDVVAEKDELFLVMEYVHGESLARLVHQDPYRGTPVPPAMAAAIFSDVLHGLHAAHEAKSPDGQALSMVHRDVTPHNVLVGVDGSARIADFGIAKTTRRDQSTSSGLLKGKLCYVAPEQIHGRRVGRATDVYAAAVSLWEALTGRVLFSAEHEARVMEKILTGATRPPSAFVPDIPPELDEVVMRGLEMRPQKRFQTAHEMAVALERMARPSSSDVGAWVLARAESAVATRVALIESLERMPPLESIALSEPILPPGSVPDVNRVSFPAPSERIDPSRARRRRRRLVAVGVLTSFCALSGGALLAHAHYRFAPAPVDVGSPSTDLSAQQALAPDELAPFAPLSEGLLSAQAAPNAPVPALGNSHGEPDLPKSARNRGPQGAPSDRKSVGSSAKPKPDDKLDDACKPPYTRDETGRKIYKRECL